MTTTETTSLHSSGPMPNPPRADLRKQVDEFIGVTFYGALMKAMRNSVVKGRYGHGGRGEEVFQSQLDFELAKRMGQAQHNQLGEVLHARLTGRPTSDAASRVLQKGGVQDTVDSFQLRTGIRPASRW